MPTFRELWDAHPGRGFVCDASVFENQCDMRMGDALRSCGVNLSGRNLRTCVTYNRHRFSGHAPGHVLAAQELADVLDDEPSMLGAGVAVTKMRGTIGANPTAFQGANGVVFIQNGWGPTDHIDVWDGVRMEMKGGAASYQGRGRHVWLWAM